MILMKQTAENGLSLHYIEIIHDHIVIFSIAFARQI